MMKRVTMAFVISLSVQLGKGDDTSIGQYYQDKY